MNYNISLIVGAGLSAVAAVLHIAIVIGGPAWYRAFGAGEQFAPAADFLGVFTARSGTRAGTSIRMKQCHSISVLDFRCVNQ